MITVKNLVSNSYVAENLTWEMFGQRMLAIFKKCFMKDNSNYALKRWVL